MQKAVVYGIGQDFFKYESEIKEKYEVVCLMDSDSSRGSKLHGIPFFKIEMLKSIDYDVVVVVPVYHRMEIIQQLRRFDVPDSKIVPYIPYQSSLLPPIGLAVQDDKCRGTCGSLKFDLKHSSDFGVLNQVYAHMEYGLSLNAESVSVIDVGMNIGLTSLFFASMDNVKSVFGYEPFPETYFQAIQNFSLNDSEIVRKIRPCQAGLSNKSCKLKIDGYNIDFSWGMRIDHLESIQQNDEPCIVLLKADDELAKIIEERRGDVIVLKLDCEGSEYDILLLLEQASILRKVDIILMETHDFREKEAVNVLKNNFIVFHQYIGTPEGLGMVYAVRRL